MRNRIQSISIERPQRFKPVTHVVFDLDGTLIDTESCYKDAANEVTTKYGKGEFTWEHKAKLMGTNLSKNAHLIIEAFGLPLTPKEFFDEVMAAFSRLIRRCKFMPGAKRIIQYFHKNKITLGLCTASKNDSYHIKVNHFGDFFKPGKYFDVIVVGGSDPEITHNKPDPEPYLVTIKRLPGNPKPEEVLVFEDSLDGMRSAIGAGTQCVLIPEEREKFVFASSTSEATMVIKSLNDFNPSLFSLPESFSAPLKLSAVSYKPLLNYYRIMSSKLRDLQLNEDTDDTDTMEPLAFPGVLQRRWSTTT